VIDEKLYENIKNKKIKALFEQHKELINLFTQSDTLSWNLIYFYIVMNFAIISAIGLIYTNDNSLQVKELIIFGLCFLGFIISLGWFFIIFRNIVYVRAIILNGQYIENRLIENGYPFDTLTGWYKMISEDKIILKNLLGEYRNLRWYEKISAINLILYAIPIVCIFWLIMSIYFLFKIF
jgi:hypothetical protein